jgi:hypothetical protein
MKKVMYALILPLLVVSGLVFANRSIKKGTSGKPISKPLCAAEKDAAMKQWEATPAGMLFKEWEMSPAGQKVYTCEAKIMKSLRDFSNMEGVVTSLSLPPGSRLGFGVMVKINEEDYILNFNAESNDELKQVKTLKVNDKIIIRSHNVSHAPKYTYPIVSGDYVERDGKMIYKRVPHKGGC